MMGEFIREKGQGKSLPFAFEDIFSVTNQSRVRFLALQTGHFVGAIVQMEGTWPHRQSGGGDRRAFPHGAGLVWP
jgi:hypothetical protein